MSTTQSTSNTQSQYHHFIPQFILKNFAHVYGPGAGKGTIRPNGEPKLYPGDKALHTLDLRNSPPELKESPVRRTFGLFDMYRDFTSAENQQDLESRLGRIECRVREIITRTCKAFNDKHNATWMSRSERNELRKFLFLMKYRGKGFHMRFSGDAEGNYTEDDKEQFLRYMSEHGYKRPLDVWYHSIRTILDLEMDNDDQWKKNLLNQIYPDDALWFIMHTEWMYLTFCTPDDPNQEFIVADNSYSVSEGPVSVAIDPVTKTHSTVLWTSYHEFGPLTPRLIMVLRSFLLPSKDEDKAKGVREWRERWYKLNASMHVNSSTAKSILADLPVSKARNSYSSVGESGMKLVDGEDGSRRSYHRFCFRFFKISTKQVNLINAIMLDNADEQHTIAFKSRDALKQTLDHFITLPADAGFKLVPDEASHPRLQYLQKLENVLHQLGSTSSLVFRRGVLPNGDQVLAALEREWAKDLPKQLNEEAKLHLKLGGTLPPIRDMDQVRKMTKLRIKIDVWSQGVDENKRLRARDNLLDLYCKQISPARLRIFLKRYRTMMLNPPDCDKDASITEVYFEGPEDVVARACEVVNPKKLNHLMYLTASQYLFSIQHPNVSIFVSGTDDQAAMELGYMSVFTGPHGNMRSIRDCGIYLLERRAESIFQAALHPRDYLWSKSRCWTLEENIELFVRAVLRRDMEELLRGKLTSTQLEELKEVLFIITYPTYELEKRWSY